MCLVTGPGQMATVGTVLEISQHERKPDGRMLIMSKGAEARPPPLPAPVSRLPIPLVLQLLSLRRPPVLTAPRLWLTQPT